MFFAGNLWGEPAEEIETPPSEIVPLRPKLGKMSWRGPRSHFSALPNPGPALVRIRVSCWIEHRAHMLIHFSVVCSSNLPKSPNMRFPSRQASRLISTCELRTDSSPWFAPNPLCFFCFVSGLFFLDVLVGLGLVRRH